MQKINFLYVALASLIPIAVGFVWYSKPLFADAWMRAAEVSEEKLKSGNMALILILTLVLSLMLSVSLMPIVIHQFGVFGVLANETGIDDPNSEAGKFIAGFMEKYGSNFRTFKHGSFHGVIASLFFALPLIGINAMFERRSFKYVAIHTGYWLITLGLMGGVICAFV
ncbi:MAG TPA: DUF1761 domain-containing protein [Flavipsychrobacter sp.]|nr:DUF1761 domain-containing protein [Flavipsychrobacter sp.]